MTWNLGILFVFATCLAVCGGAWALFHAALRALGWLR